ncbi:MAG: NAD(P)-dependent alcohol dehydrogenase [Flavobacteriales bacterium]|nr:NAD(P)-dependent alcohol dehydrogenase [Flavobacteriales bacterium]
MLAITKTKYGGPEVLSLAEVEKPAPKEDELLVKVEGNSVNPADWHVMRGSPFFARLSFGLFKPKNKILGADFAGVIEAVGSKVQGFEVGDHVYGESLRGGAFAEYLAVKPAACAKYDSNIPAVFMACVPVAGLTAFQAVETHGNVVIGERVLINGASGGVGHFAVQLAKWKGAHVTAVCSKKNESFVRNLGADDVIPYDEIDIHSHTEVYDVVFDIHGNLNYKDFKRMGKRGVLVGFTGMGNMLNVLINSGLRKYPLAQFTAEANTPDLEILARLIHDGVIEPKVTTVYAFEEIPEAIRVLEEMRTTGKIGVRLGDRL